MKDQHLCLVMTISSAKYPGGLQAFLVETIAFFWELYK